jgi:hypothetical protein
MYYNYAVPFNLPSSIAVNRVMKITVLNAELLIKIAVPTVKKKCLEIALNRVMIAVKKKVKIAEYPK